MNDMTLFLMELNANLHHNHSDLLDVEKMSQNVLAAKIFDNIISPFMKNEISE